MAKMNAILIGILLIMFATAGVYAYMGYSGNEALSTHYMTEQKWSDSSCSGCHVGVYEEVSESYHVEQDLKEWSSIMEYGVAVDSIDEDTMAVTYGQVHPGGGYMADYGVDIDCMICHEQVGGYDFEARAESIASGDFANANEAAIEESRAELQKEPLYVASYVLDVLAPLPLVTEVHDEVNGAPSKALCGSNCHTGDIATTAVAWTLEDSASYDVHDAVDCQECHETEEHKIGGRAYMFDSDSIHEVQSGVLDCDSSGCHEGISHGPLVDGHLETVSCETCHIPALPGSDTIETPVIKSFSWANGVREDETYDSEFTPTISWSAGVYHDILPTVQEQTNSSLLKPFNVITGIWWDEGIDVEVLVDPDNSSSIGNPIIPSEVLNADADGDGIVSEEEIHSYDGNSDGTPDYPSAVLRHVEMYYQVSHNIVSSSVGLADPLVCGDCHGTTSTAINWTELGYEKDPAATDPATDFSTKTIEVTIPGAKPTELEREPAF
ncbi:methanogenesis multiheme c-type cytochrome [Methanolobus sp.]|jgi:methanogenesis multiheme c-type cytochrome|uniref:methanogenesis multiheme c-type cytochrome n=1 Tax=Methanolobus sp. TaxID=1874737 RepID=UPI0025DEF6D2|nr:methanogenesis multiheme c-type cytochrome [Methanolobus sp.]